MRAAPIDEPTEHLDHANQKTSVFAMSVSRENPSGKQEIEHGGAFHGAATGDREEMGLIGPRRAPNALGQVQDDRCGRSLDLVPETGGSDADP